MYRVCVESMQCSVSRLLTAISDHLGEVHVIAHPTSGRSVQTCSDIRPIFGAESIEAV